MDSFKPCRSITQTERYLLSFDPQDCFDNKWLKLQVDLGQEGKLVVYTNEKEKISSVIA